MIKTLISRGQHFMRCRSALGVRKGGHAFLTPPRASIGLMALFVVTVMLSSCNPVYVAKHAGSYIQEHKESLSDVTSIENQEQQYERATLDTVVDGDTLIVRLNDTR